MTVKILITTLQLLLILISCGVSYSRNVLTCIILNCIFGLFSSTLYLVLNAPDVAITEAAVCSCLSTVFLLGAISKVGTKNVIPNNGKYLTEIVLLIPSIAGMIAYTAYFLPKFGDSANPIHNLTEFYKENSIGIGVDNMVTGILASFRAYDTLGETTVIFIAGCGVSNIMKINTCE